MASNEYSHCNNCLHWDKENLFCNKHENMATKKGWCGEHIERNPLDANDIGVEYRLRRDHIMLEMQHGKDNVKPVEDLLKSFGWDGVERLKQGKWPEEQNTNSTQDSI